MTHVHEDIGAFVLGALDDDAERRVREHLATCQECAAAHAEIADIPALLDLAVVTGATEEEPLPPAIEERLLDRFARERTEPPGASAAGGRGSRSAPASALAGAAVAAAALVFGLELRAQRRPPAVAVPARLPADRPGAGQRHRARRARTSQSGTVVRLWVENLPGGTKDVYEVWCDAPGWSASAGTFKVDAKGDAYVILTTAVKRASTTGSGWCGASTWQRQGRDLRHPGREVVAEPGDAVRVSPGMRRIAVLAATAAFAFAGCGGDDEPESAATPARPRHPPKPRPKPPPKHRPRPRRRCHAGDRRRPGRRAEVHRDRVHGRPPARSRSSSPTTPRSRTPPRSRAAASRRRPRP